LAFGPFEVNAAGGELFKSGIPIRLPAQPFQILLLLLAHPGDLVTREELRERVWADGTFVDFEHSLNVAMNRLRRALSDSAENPRYIQTLPGRGYRFIDSVREEGRAEPLAFPVSRQMPAESPKQFAKLGSRKTWIAAGALASTVLVASLVIWMGSLTSASRRDLRVQQLTTNSAENPIVHAVISPDGRYLAYGDLAGILVRVIATGESQLLPRPRSLSPGDEWFPAAWLPDGTRILATSIASTGVTGWSVSVIGGAARVLRENVLVQSASPDGTLIAFIVTRRMSPVENAINRRLMRNSEIWIMASDGENARRVVSGDNLTYFGSVRWSPDGKRIAYQEYRLADGALVDYTIEICDLKGGTPSIIVSRRHYGGESIDHNFPEDFCWLRDGRIVYAVREPPPNIRDSNLWAVAVEKSGRLHSPPQEITKLSGFHMEGLSATTDGTKLLVESSSDQSYVYVGRLAADGKLEDPRRLTPNQRYNTPYGWTSDSKTVIFRSDRTGTFALYKQALDQEVPEMIVTGPGNPMMTRVSPDGAWLIYQTLMDGQREYRLMRVPLAGGRPQVILERTAVENFDCPRRPGAPCVICESRGKEKIFSTIDPSSSARHEVFRLVRDALNWRLSSDGSRIAMILDSQQGSIEVRSLTGQMETTIEVKGWPNPFTVDWAADDKTLFVSHAGLMASPSGPIGATILRVDFEGHAQPVWETRGARYAWGIPSPDGKYLAIRGATTERNAWMVENF